MSNMSGLKLSELNLVRDVIERLCKGTDDYDFGVHIQTGDICMCTSISCTECGFNNNEESCEIKRIRWLINRSFREEKANKKVNLPDNIATDTLIWVKFKEDDRWEPRYFSHIDTDGTVFCYIDGKTSKTTPYTSGWSYAKMPDTDN